MPAYNASAFIAEAIGSVIGQTHTDWELLVMDDGSTDDTRDLVLHFAAADKRVKFLHQPNKGQGIARATAIGYATGKWIALLDADDLWVPAKLSCSIDQLEKNNADLFFSAVWGFDQSLEHEKWLIPVGEKKWQGEDAIKMFLESNRIPTVSAIFSREMYDAAGGFADRRIAEDYELWLKMLACNAVFVSSAEALGYYRRHAASTTASDGVQARHCIDVFSHFAAKFPMYGHLVLEAKLYWMETRLCTHMQVDKMIEMYTDYGLISAAWSKLLNRDLRLLPGRVKKKLLDLAISSFLVQSSQKLALNA